jgi:SAM-dependent methyltransferase
VSRLDISLFGAFAVTLDDTPANSFEADTARALLAYLALHAGANAPCRRETLAGLLWPDQPNAEARHNLRQALTRVRKAIGDRTAGASGAEHPFLQITRQTIRLAPEGDYRLVPDDGDLPGLDPGSFDLVLSVFTFDNIPDFERKVSLLTALRRLLEPGGRLINLVSSPVIYLHVWASFSTTDFPENRDAGDGDTVRIVMLDVADSRPVEDVLCTGEAYEEAYSQAGLVPIDVHRPLGCEDEPFEWVSETEISPWAVYVLERAPE